MAVETDFSFFEGEKVRITFTPVTEEDLSNKTLRFRMREHANSSANTVEKTSGSGITTPDSIGTIQVDLDSVDSVGKEGVYVYDVMDVTSGSEAVLANGKITVNPSLYS